MKLKDTKGRTIEHVFLIVAAVLTFGLLTYMIFFVHSVVQTADIAFDISKDRSKQVIGFDFARYNRIMGIATSTPASSTVSAVASSSPVSSTTVR